MCRGARDTTQISERSQHAHEQSACAARAWESWTQLPDAPQQHARPITRMEINPTGRCSRGGYEEEQDSLNHGYSFPPATLVQLPPRGSYFSVTAGSACTGMDALHAGAAHRQEDEQFQN